MKDIYRKREDIFLTKNIGEEAKQQREYYKTADRKLISNSIIEHFNIDEVDKIPDGKFRIRKGNAIFDCFFKKGKSGKLWVFPSAARTRANGRAKVPLFERWSYYKILEDSILCVSDPMYYDYPDLDCGWFWGNENENYREYLADIVEKIVDLCELNSDEVIFMGASAGGTAAVHTAAIFGHGTAVSINGQLNFESETRTKRMEAFKKCTGINPAGSDKFNRNKLYKVVEEASNVKFVIITNAYSYADIVDHLIYFTDKLEDKPKLGLSVNRNIVYWIYEAASKNPHNAFDDRNLIFAIEYLTKIGLENINEYDGLYQLFSSFWNSKYVDAIREEAISLELVPSFFEVNENSLNHQIVQETVEATDNPYNRFALGSFRKGDAYLIKFKAHVSDSGVYTAGIYDWSKKRFLYKYTFENDKKNEIAFYCADSNLEFLLYSGIYGFAHNKSIEIDECQIYKCSNPKEEYVRQYRADSLSQSARFDVFINNDTGIQFENMSSALYDVETPDWFNRNGKGYVITSDKGYAKLRIIARDKGELSFDFRSIDIKKNGKRIPFNVDYTSISINNEKIIEKSKKACHDEPIKYKRNVEKDEILLLEVCWRRHIE